MMRIVLGLLLLMGSLSAHPALATDGVIEINQACVATGCVPGDVPGFPVTLLNEGSYRLTSNLVVPPAVPGAIFVDNLIDLDLNGFAIKGPGSCSGNVGSVTCVGLSGYGVFLQNFSANARPSRVRNGTITGVSTGLDVRFSTSVAVTDVRISGVGTGILGQQATISIEGSHVEQTSQSCMFFIEPFGAAGSVVSVRSSLVKDCHDSGIAADPTIRLNVSETEVVGIGNLGILAGVGGVIRNVRVAAAGSDGLSCSDSCSVEGSRFLKSGGRGIFAGDSSSISGNEVGGNSGAAIIAGSGSTISRNTVSAADLTGGKLGIQCISGCGVFENVVRPSQKPLDLGADSRSGRNVLSLFATPPSLGASAGDNLCSGSNC